MPNYYGIAKEIMVHTFDKVLYSHTNHNLEYLMTCICKWIVEKY